MSTAGQKFMTELSTRSINAAAASASGSTSVLADRIAAIPIGPFAILLGMNDELHFKEVLAARTTIVEALRGAAQAGKEPDLNDTAVALLRRAFTAAKLPPKLESDISIFLLALPSTTRESPNALGFKSDVDLSEATESVASLYSLPSTEGRTP